MRFLTQILVDVDFIIQFLWEEPTNPRRGGPCRPEDTHSFCVGRPALLPLRCQALPLLDSEAPGGSCGLEAARSRKCLCD